MLFLADYFHSFFNNFAYLLETVLDESFWQLVLGQRWFGLVKRYIGNDAVMFGIFLSLGRKCYYDERQHTRGRMFTLFYSQQPSCRFSTPFTTGSKVSLTTCSMYRSRLLQSKPFIALCKNSSSKITSNCLISRYNQQCGDGVLTWIVDWHCILFCQHVSGVTMYSTIKRRNHEYEEERVKLGLMPRKYSSPLGYKRTEEELGLTLDICFRYGHHASRVL